MSAYTKESVPVNDSPQLADAYTYEELAAILEARVNFQDQLHAYDRNLFAAAAHTIRQQAQQDKDK